MKFPIDRINHEWIMNQSCLIFEFWDFGRIMAFAIGPSLKVEILDRDFLSPPWKFWSIEHNHALYWKFGTLAGLRSRPQVQMTMGSIQKNIPGGETFRRRSHMLHSDSRNSSYAQKSVPGRKSGDNFTTILTLILVLKL
jgi:hypothetical protein